MYFIVQQVEKKKLINNYGKVLILIMSEERAVVQHPSEALRYSTMSEGFLLYKQLRNNNLFCNQSVELNNLRAKR